MTPIGLTKDVGWQVGVRKTFAISPAAAWELITSEEGMRAWLGELPGFQPDKGAAYQLDDGTHGEITVYEPGSHLRLTWLPPGYSRSAIIQVRVIPNGEKTVIGFHQEHLPDADARVERKAFFKQAVTALSAVIDSWV